MHVITDLSNRMFQLRRTIDLNSGMQCGWIRVEAGTQATFNAEDHIYAQIYYELDVLNSSNSHLEISRT